MNKCDVYQVIYNIENEKMPSWSLQRVFIVWWTMCRQHNNRRQSDNLFFFFSLSLSSNDCLHASIVRATYSRSFHLYICFIRFIFIFVLVEILRSFRKRQVTVRAGSNGLLLSLLCVQPFESHQNGANHLERQFIRHFSCDFEWKCHIDHGKY